MTTEQYIENINRLFKVGNTTEHTFRGDLARLIESLATDVIATNEPKRQSCGAPDYILTKKEIPVGFIEAKDIGDKDLGGLKSSGNKEQFERYRSALENLIFTDYLDFHFYRNGELNSKISIGEVIGNRTSSHLSNSYTYGSFNRLTATQQATYTYDNNGAMISRTDASGTISFTHDSDARLVSSFDDQFNFSQYGYDALGRRVSFLHPHQLPHQYTYDGHDVLVSYYGGLPTRYQNGPGIDNKLSTHIVGSSPPMYHLQDHLGTTFGTTNNSGAFSSAGISDSFGSPGGIDFTGREYDSFNQLYYYRARMYDPQLGRFISEDPIGFNGGDINLYGYVWNNPLRFRDPLGLFPIFWPWDRHQEITRRALKGSATSRQIQSLAWANANFDKRTQDLEFSPQHAMRLPGQSVEDAQIEANRFVRDKICKARVFASRGWNTDALHQLAEAMHTVQDANSPTHKGFQESWPYGIIPVIKNLSHYIHEALFPGSENLNAAEDATRKVWDYFNGTPMPRDFFSNSSNGEGTCTCPGL